MFSEDYVLRIIRQATAALARIIGLKNSGQYQEAEKDIDKTIGLLVGIEAETIKFLDDESLFLLLMKEEELDLGKLELIADLYQEEGDIQRIKGQLGESHDCYTRSLNYYLKELIYLQTSHEVELAHKIDELLLKLDIPNIPELTLLNLFCHFENMGEFVRAESVISDLVARNNTRVDIVNEMRAFYERLLKQSPKELAATGMNRTHIQNKLKKLKKLL